MYQRNITTAIPQLGGGLSSFVRRGNDLVLVAEIAGHKRLETTRRYSLPSGENREHTIENLQVDSYEEAYYVKSSNKHTKEVRTMGKRNYLIEGVSGTGKTSVCQELRRRGYVAINGDR